MIKVDDVQIFARTAPGTDEFGRGMDGPREFLLLRFLRGAVLI